MTRETYLLHNNISTVVAIGNKFIGLPTISHKPYIHYNRIVIWPETLAVRVYGK